MNSTSCGSEMKLSIISVDLSVSSSERDQEGLFVSVLPPGGFFTILEQKVQNFCFLVTVIPAGKGTLCKKMIKSFFGKSTNLSGIPSSINVSNFCNPNSTIPFTNEIRPLNSLYLGYHCCTSELNSSHLPRTGKLVTLYPGP